MQEAGLVSRLKACVGDQEAPAQRVRTKRHRSRWLLQLTALVLILFGSPMVWAQTVVGHLNVGIPLLDVQVTDQIDNNLNDTITIQAVNSSSTTYVCHGQVGFFSLSSGSDSMFPRSGDGVVPPGGPYVIATAVNSSGSGLGNTLAYDSASCTPRSASTGGGSGGSTGITMGGNISFASNIAASTVTLRVDTIVNHTNALTGPLQLRLYALSGPYGQAGVTAYQMALSTLPSSCTTGNSQLEASLGCQGVVIPTALTLPPPGTYVAGMLLEEYSPGQCTSSSGYCVVDYINFDGPLVISSPGQPGVASGGIELIGTSTYTASTSTSALQLAIPEILNSSSLRTTGILRIEFWLTAQKYAGGTITGKRVYTSSLPTGCTPTLAPGGWCQNITLNGSLSNIPSAGTYYATLVISEFDPANCTTSDQYCIATALDYNGTFVVPAATTPAGSVGGTAGSGGGGAMDVGSLVLFGAATLLPAIGRRHRRRRQDVCEPALEESSGGGSGVARRYQA